MKEAIIGVARHLLTAGGGYLVGQGLVDAAMAEQAVGALLTLIGVVWSVYDKRVRAA